jgi:hypothetical protein
MDSPDVYTPPSREQAIKYLVEAADEVIAINAESHFTGSRLNHAIGKLDGAFQTFKMVDEEAGK